MQAQTTPSPSRRWAEITQCVGPWEGSPPKTMQYDLDVLGGGYDPHNVLTSLCHRCGKRWSYDSPTGECGHCERETLVESLHDDNRKLRGEPPLYRDPPPRPPYKVVMTPTFVTSYADMTGTDESTARTHLRESGLHLAHVSPAPSDLEAAEMARHVLEFYEVNIAALCKEKQAMWCAWWATRKDMPLPAEDPGRERLGL